jgi:3-phosphoshikimate 1-carboxyvinyltransferase
MSLPDLIEIVPIDHPVRADITVPGSKSITNRALILGALGDGETALRGALWSEDTQVMVECLQELGFMVNVAPDPREPANRTITIYGKGGAVPAGGSVSQPLELFVSNAGTAARFLAAMVCLGSGVYRLIGSDRMHERPQAALFQALRQLGYRIEATGDRLPALIHGGGRRPGVCQVSIAESSQFASALILSSRVGGWRVEVQGENADESPYVVLTSELVKTFLASRGTFDIEPDASSASYFWGADWLLSRSGAASIAGSEISICQPFVAGWQIDARFREVFQGAFPSSLSRQSDLGDSIMTAIVLAPFAPYPVRFSELGRLRMQECERVAALRTELAKCGAQLTEEGDTLTVFPSTLHGAEIETYNDHRMAMCFAIPGLKIPGIKLKNPSCVKKTFPNFFRKLAAPPPKGLGARIVNGRDGRPLSDGDLFAA